MRGTNFKWKNRSNGSTVFELGTKVNPDKDEIKYNGKVVKLEDEKIYILLNKPIGYVTTAKEQFGRDMVLDLVKVNKRIVPSVVHTIFFC